MSMARTDVTDLHDGWPPDRPTPCTPPAPAPEVLSDGGLDERDAMRFQFKAAKKKARKA